MAMMLSAPPVPVHASTWLRSREARKPYSLAQAPTNTPVCERWSESAGIPACSRASTATSSMSRCCGSMKLASRGVIPKKSASKPAMSPRNEPQRVVSASACAVCGAPSSNACHRSSGTVVTAERRSVRNSHSASGPLTSPGNRQPTPMMAIDSDGTAVWPSTLPSASASGLIRARTRLLIVGFCQMSIGDTGRASSSVSSPASTTPSREPTPSSLKGVSAST